MLVNFFFDETVFAAFLVEFDNLFQIQSGENDLLYVISLHLIGLIDVLPPLKQIV